MLTFVNGENIMYYAIIPFDEPPKEFIDRIREIDPEPYISQSPKVYFAKSTGNASYISNQIGFTNSSDNQITGIVIPIPKGYSGFATPDLWDYLKGVK